MAKVWADGLESSHMAANEFDVQYTSIYLEP